MSPNFDGVEFSESRFDVAFETLPGKRMEMEVLAVEVINIRDCVRYID